MNPTAHNSIDYATSQRMEATNRLAAGVAHEFNNVLQIVSGYVRFAHDSLPEGCETQRDLDCALEAADRAATLSSRLLQFAQAIDGDEEIADVKDAVESLQLLQRPIVGDAVRVEVEVEDSLPPAAAADGLLRRALLNLCVNARDAMPEGGVVRIKASVLEFEQSQDCAVGTLRAGEYICVTVQDEGGGIAEGAKQRLFEPFFTTKEIGKGTGLGLSMVASFVMRSGGGVRFSSKPGEGACFDLYLPVALDLLVDDGVGLDGVVALEAR